MPIFYNSKDSINKLSKLIAQNPSFPTSLRKATENLISCGIIKNSKKYLEEQETVLKEAEKIGLSNTGYIFEIIHRLSEYPIKNYMIYKNIDNEMVPIIEDFKKSETCTINSLEEVVKHCKSRNINSLVTFSPHDQDCFYSVPWCEGKTDNDFHHGRHAEHLETDFYEKEIEFLKNNSIEYQVLPKDLIYDFNLKLKQLYL